MQNFGGKWRTGIITHCDIFQYSVHFCNNSRALTVQQIIMYDKADWNLIIILYLTKVILNRWSEKLLLIFLLNYQNKSELDKLLLIYPGMILPWIKAHGQNLGLCCLWWSFVQWPTLKLQQSFWHSQIFFLLFSWSFVLMNSSTMKWETCFLFIKVLKILEQYKYVIMEINYNNKLNKYFFRFVPIYFFLFK